MFISMADSHMSSLYRKELERNGIIVDNKYINGLEIHLKCVTITFIYGFSVFNVCSRRSLINIDFVPQQTLNPQTKD